jgi:16S rRNA (cytosine967-C5)-methyltransferase
MECQTVYLNDAGMKPLSQRSPLGAWATAAALLERWLARRERLDALLEEAGRKWPAAGDPVPPMQAIGTDATRLYGLANFHGEALVARQERARCQHLLFGAVRHLGRVKAALDAVISQPPRARLQAVLLVAGFELLEAAAAPTEEGQAARIVHHAVGQAKTMLSPPEARLVNAVLRKLASSPGFCAETPVPAADAAELGRFFSHPEWLVRRWLAQFGADATHRLLTWNQTPPPVYARWRSTAIQAGPSPVPTDAAPSRGETAEAADVVAGVPLPAFLQPTAWAGFYGVPAGNWPEIEQLLAAGALYLQDPATMIAPELLDPKPGETVVDLCAAPGGKSLLLADLLEERSRRAGAGGGAGVVVAVDLPDVRRIARLKENLAKARTTGVALVQADVLQLSPRLLKEHNLPGSFSAILLDVPCSNTGVMRHRVDVKWRLREADIAKHAGQQLALLAAAARFVAPGGRLVYSTCSLESEENEEVVEAFLRGARGRFVLEQTRHSRPWENGCDGAGAFLLRRNA